MQTQAQVQEQAGQVNAQIVQGLGAAQEQFKTASDGLGSVVDQLKPLIEAFASNVSMMNHSSESAAKSVSASSRSLVERGESELALLAEFGRKIAEFQSAMESGAPMVDSLNGILGEIRRQQRQVSDFESSNQRTQATLDERLEKWIEQLSSHGQSSANVASLINTEYERLHNAGNWPPVETLESGFQTDQYRHGESLTDA